MLPYTYAAARQAEERYNDTLRDGELAHLLRHAKPARVGPLDLVAGTVGRLLAAVGGRLQERCALPSQTADARIWQPASHSR